MDQFSFSGFSPSKAIKMKADRAFERVCQKAPSDAKVSAIVDLDGVYYHCVIEVGLPHFPIKVETSHKNASLAIDKAELTMLRKLDRWACANFIKLEDSPLRSPLRAS